MSRFIQLLNGSLTVRACSITSVELSRNFINISKIVIKLDTGTGGILPRRDSHTVYYMDHGMAQTDYNRIWKLLKPDKEKPDLFTSTP